MILLLPLLDFPVLIVVLYLFLFSGVGVVRRHYWPKGKWKIGMWLSNPHHINTKTKGDTS